MGQLPSSAFQAYDPSNASSIQPGPFALYSVALNQILPTQMNEGFAEVDAKVSGWNLVDPSDLQSTLLTDIEPVVIGPDGKVDLLNGHHTYTSLMEANYGASNPTVYVNVVANFSNLTVSKFWTQMQSGNLVLPLNEGVPQTLDTNSLLRISAGGTARGTVVSGAGEFDAGSAVSTSVLGGSWMSVESGGVATGTMVSNSVLLVSGTASGTQVNSGATEFVLSGGVDVGAQINSAGELVSSRGTASSATISGGTLEVASGGSTGSGAVTFAVSGGGTLRLDDSAHFGGLVAGFAQSDLIDLRDIAFTSATLLSWTQLTSGGTASGTLTVSGGGSVANIELLGQYSVGQFTSASDGHGGTVIGATDTVAAAALSATLAASA